MFKQKRRFRVGEVPELVRGHPLEDGDQVDDPAVLGGQAFLAQFERNPSVLPPRKEAEGSLLGLLKNPLFALPKDTSFTVTSYKPKLGLNYLSPPSIALGVDRYGQPLERKPTHLLAAAADGPGGFTSADHTWDIVIPLKTAP
jgi:hypothetical protein